jgi:ribosomal protein S12 methylthiotransferase accessory factor
VLAGESPDFRRVFMSSSNGLASGNTIEEALCHALCELIERDALALHAAAVGLRRSLGDLLSGLELTYDPRPSRTMRRINHDGLPPRASRILRRLREGGLAVYLRDITSDIGVAAIACALVERRLEGWVMHAGFGCHPDARVALTRALTESYQSRIAYIQGGREDLPRLPPGGPSARDPREIHGAGPSGPFSLVRSIEHASVGEDVLYLLGALESAGLTKVVAFDMTDAAIGIPVVRVVVPGLECWSLFRSHTARSVLGARALGLVH